MSNLNTIGIDLAKRIVQVCIINGSHRKPLVNKAIKAKDLLAYMANQPISIIAMEACSSAHFWARRLQSMGHEVKLIAPQFVTPFRKGHKTDANDALAIAESAMRPDLRTVPIKTLIQQDLQSIHRLRELLVKQRTQLINQLHGLLQEYGIASGQGQRALMETLMLSLEDAANELSYTIRVLFSEQMDMLSRLNQRIDRLTKQLEAYAQELEPCQRLMEIEGVGVIGATQLYCALGDGRHFRSGRQAAAYLGLTPKQHSSGGKARLRGIGHGGHPTLKATLI
ncbi:MAG: IS110 family transposase, partial [Pseudomonadales bacterium]|nr:IS110 family transposase [Pseudomonadales bacterium]